MTCSFLFLTGKMSISSVFVTMLAFNLAVFPCPLFHKLKAQGAKKTADFLQFRHEALSSVACPIPLSLIHGPYTVASRSPVPTKLPSAISYTSAFGLILSASCLGNW